MGVVILLYDQLLFRPIVAWAGKFRVELSVGEQVERSWVLEPAPAHQLDPSRRAAAVRRAALGRHVAAEPAAASFREGVFALKRVSRVVDVVWMVVIAAVAAWAMWSVVAYVATELSWSDVGEVALLTFYTLLRVARADGDRDGRSGCRSASGSASGRAGPRRCSRSPSSSPPSRPTCCSARRSAWCWPSTSTPTSGSAC